MWNAEVSNVDSRWMTNQQYYWPKDGDKIDFFGWFIPAGTTGVTAVNAAGGLQLQYTLPASPDNQPDLLVAVTRNQTFSTVASNAVAMDFQHQLTAVNVIIDENVAPGTITEVAFLNIYTSATLAAGGAWDYTSGLKPVETAYATSFNTTDNDMLVDDDHRTVLANLMMIPQTFNSADQQMRIKMMVDGVSKTLFANLSSDLDTPTSWVAGTTVTYKISTSAVNVLRIGSVTYPSSWSAASGVKSAYEENDEMGVFSVDATGQVHYANKKFTLNGSGQWACADAATTLFEPGCTYYAYYPWQETLAGAPAVNDNVLVESGLPTADEFFCAAVAAWTPATDQGTADKLNAQDLQIARANVSTALSTVTLSMAHTMGLTSVTMASQMVPKVLYLNANGTENYRTTETQSVVTSNNFTGNLPCAISNKHYFVVRPSTNTTFRATADSKLNEWTEDITANVAASAYTNYTASSPVITRNYIYRGWVYDYTGGGQSFTVPATGNYTLECWGAQGGSMNGWTGGKGAYTKGTVLLNSQTTLYVFVGATGSSEDCVIDNWHFCPVSFNGSGSSEFRYGRPGGGATDFRLEAVSATTADWMNFNSLRSRIMVAAGGGGVVNRNITNEEKATNQYGDGLGGYGGGLIGGDGTAVNNSGGYGWLRGFGATQTSPGKSIAELASSENYTYGEIPIAFGAFGYSPVNCGQGTSSRPYEDAQGTGGGGYYGGGSSGHAGSGGGSSFISGHPGCRALDVSEGKSTSQSNLAHKDISAVDYNIHYSGYSFSNTEMIDGGGCQWTTNSRGSAKAMPKPGPAGGTETGHTGNGYARITENFIE